jgi:ketosteroid isomerase-like protein
MNPKGAVRAFVDAHNAHDIEKLMAHLAEDSVMIDVAAPISLNSKTDVRKLFTMNFQALPDVHFEITGMISEGNKAFATLRTTGTGWGEWAGRDITHRKALRRVRKHVHRRARRPDQDLHVLQRHGHALAAARDLLRFRQALHVARVGRGSVGHTAVLLERRCLMLGGRTRTHTRQAPALGLSPR